MAGKNDIIVVTGGAGFIGSNLLKELERRGFRRLVCVDTLGTGEKWKNISTLTNLDIILPKDVKDFIHRRSSEIGAVVHLGAISSTTETDVDLIYSTNVMFTLQLLSSCSLHGIPFIYASSASTYGDGSNGFSDSQDISFLSLLQPLNAYAWSKSFVDKRIWSDCEGENRSQVVGLKFFNVYGPNEFHKGSQMSVMCKFYQELSISGCIRLFKSCNRDIVDGEQRRDFVYVGDCVDVIIWMIKHREVSGLFNVGSGEARTFNDVARIICSEAGKEPVIEYVVMPQALQKHYQNYTCADLSKLRSVGYDKAMTPIEEGIRIYINEYLKKAK